MNLKKFIIVISILIFNTQNLHSDNLKNKKQEIANKLYDIELSGGDLLGYSREILLHLEKSGIKPSKYKSSVFDDVDRMNFSNGIDIYSLLSGGLAIRESLQLETILPFDSAARDINPKTADYINIKAHPYGKMLKNNEYKIYAIDKTVPDDFYYIHFNNLNKGLNFLKLLNGKYGFLYSRFQPYSIDFMVKEKLMTQLAIIESQEFTSGVSEIVITGSDPFVIEGSDLTLIIDPANKPIFNQTIEKMRRDIKNRYSAKEQKITLSEYQGTHIYTDNRKVWSIFITLPNGLVLVSNSIKAIEKVIDTYTGNLPPLADALDYKYMRSIYPAGTENEDGFIYLSDKFIRYLVSPELRIKEARRVYEGIRLSVLEKYMIYYFQLTGKYPASIEEIVELTGGASQSTHLKNELESIKRNPLYNQAIKFDQTTLSNWNSFSSALSNPASKSKKKNKTAAAPGKENFIYDLKLFYRKIAGKTAYTPAEVMDMIESLNSKNAGAKKFTGLSIKENSFSAKSDIYGRIGFMTPIIELDIGNISKREAEMYKEFADSYNNFRKGFLGPIGVKIKTDPEFSIETYIFPLINSPIYSAITNIFGGNPIDLHPDNRLKGDTFSIALKIDPKALGDYLGDSTSNFKLEDIFKGEIQFHMNDSIPFIDFDQESYASIIRENVDESSDMGYAALGLLSWTLSHPVRLSLPIKKANDGMLFVESLIKNIITSNKLNNLLKDEYYAINYNGYEIRVIKLKFFNILIKRLYLSERDNTLHIATTEKYIKDVLDSKIGPTPKAIKGNSVIVYRPPEMIIEKDAYITGIVESGLEKSRKNLGTIKLLGLIAPNTNSKDLPDFMYENFGFKPICPLGGDYIFDKSTGSVRNSIYGSYPTNLKLNPNSNGIVQQYIKNLFELSEIRVELMFTPEGMMTKIINKK